MSETTILAQWEEIQEALRAALPEASYNTWISNLAVEKISANEFILGAANKFVKQWIEKNYLTTISEAIRSTLNIDPNIIIKISVEKFREHRQSLQQLIGQNTDTDYNDTLALTTKPKSEKLPLFSQSQHSLDSFVEIPQNSFALSALKQILKNPGEYTPLTIFSAHGLGKTHLLHGLCNSFSQTYPKKKIICLSAQMFVQQFSTSMINNTIAQFRQRFNESDLLVIDDFQYMGTGKKVASQNELADTLDNLCTAGKQVIFASSSAIHDVPGINSMLASRISSGLQVRLDPLTPESRQKLLSKLEPGLNPEQARDIASRLNGDIREIEGIIKTIRAVNKFTGTSANNPDILHSLNISQKRTLFNISEIISAVSVEFNIPIIEIKGKKRTGDITRARRVAIHLCRHLTDSSLIDIGLEFGGRKHPTIMNILKTSPLEPTRLNLNKLENLLRSLGSSLTVNELLSRQKEIF